MRRVGLSALIVALAAIPALAAGQASAAAPARSWSRLNVRCIEQSNGLVYAHVTTTLSVTNKGIGAGWVTNLRLKARLIEGTGLSIQRSWRTNRFPVHSDLLQDHHYQHALAVNTDNVNPDAAEWTVQVKEIWDRKAPWSDIVREIQVPFDTSNCQPGAAPITLG